MSRRVKAFALVIVVVVVLSVVLPPVLGPWASVVNFFVGVVLGSWAIDQ